ncbi:hypothetical protein HKX48_003260, partial [Thoreauomyces humboldtii]
CQLTEGNGVRLISDDGFDKGEGLELEDLPTDDLGNQENIFPQQGADEGHGVATRSFYGLGPADGTEIEDDSDGLLRNPNISVSEALAYLVQEAEAQEMEQDVRLLEEIFADFENPSV